MLSIGVDGSDYWIWAAEDNRPRTVVIEDNAALLAGHALVQPRDA